VITLDWENKKNHKKLACGFKSHMPIKNQNQNLLIRSDNLNALKSLTHGYKSKIDVIYIDPPYNTKNHKFLYDDKFDTHSKWLGFMYPRLILACGLLSDEGVIFISIDDNEVAHLKLLCNEVFGEDNFISQFVWQKKNKPSFLHQKVAKMNEYILAYAKDINKAPMLSTQSSKPTQKYPLNFKNNPQKELYFAPWQVEFGLKDGVIKAQDMSSKTIECALLDDVEIKNGKNANGFKMRGGWRYTQEYLEKLLKDGARLSVGKIPFRVNLVKNSSKPKMMNNLLTKATCHMPTYEDANSELVELFGFEAFSKPKPIKLIQTLVESVTYHKKDAIVLDFFGGSGTTALSVIKLNSKDNGNRKYILVQDGKKIKPNSIAYRHGYTDIYEIMKQRINLFYSKNKDKKRYTEVVI